MDDTRIELLRRVCKESHTGFAPCGAVQTRNPKEAFARIATDLIDLNAYIDRQIAFERNHCGHILCGDTRSSCAIIGLALRLFKPSVVYEIGRYRGWSTSQMAFALKENFEETGDKTKFISIDPHHGAPGGPGWKGDQCGGDNEWNISRSNLIRAGIDDFVTPVKAFSGEYVSEVEDAIDFIFVDGDHTYEAAKADVALYGEKMAPGGICVLHDVWAEKDYSFENYGPSKVYGEAGPEWEKVGFTWDVGILRRK